MPVPICESKGCFEFAQTRFRFTVTDEPRYFCERHAHEAERTNELAEGRGRDLPYEFIEWLQEVDADV